jgi:hypothetical protein
LIEIHSVNPYQMRHLFGGHQFLGDIFYCEHYNCMWSHP